MVNSQMEKLKINEKLFNALFDEIYKLVSPRWLKYSDKDWKTVSQVFNLHFHLENIINLLLTIYFLGSATREKSSAFRKVVLEEVDFLRKLRMLQRLGWIDGKGYEVATELNNFRRDFAHPKRDIAPKRIEEFRKENFFEKYNKLVKKMIRLVVIKDKDYQKRLDQIYKKRGGRAS